MRKWRIRYTNIKDVIANAVVVDHPFYFPMWDGKDGFIAEVWMPGDEDAAYKYAVDVLSRNSEMRRDGVKYHQVGVIG